MRPLLDLSPAVPGYLSHTICRAFRLPFRAVGKVDVVQNALHDGQETIDIFVKQYAALVSNV